MTFESLIDRYSRRHPRMFFVQVGGFDGATYDPIRPYVVRDAWRGIILEPNPEPFAKLRELYASTSDVVCLNLAIARTRGILPLHFVPGDASALEWAGAIGTLAPDKGRINEFGEAVRTIPVPCLPLADLVAEHDVRAIDLLQIDVEGYDFEVIQSLDFTVVRPTIVHWEDRHLREQEKIDCVRFFQERGYTVFTERHPNDSTAFLPDALL